jgi:hypothetical protein
MNLRKIGWAGTRTERPAEMAESVESVLGLRLDHKIGDALDRERRRLRGGVNSDLEARSVLEVLRTGR